MSSAADDVAELGSAVDHRDFHRLRPERERDPFPLWADVPDWVPRTGYALPTRDILRAVESGLKGLGERAAQQ
ncbi:hypothetical protein [Streptomyces sp. NPDC056544]|uniref:hypothetical protein n=1 Tax=unclassified Streptomyces TaxID=2593676 RepID=UPI003677D4A0